MGNNTAHTFIDTVEQLEAFKAENKGITWMAFDTEFVGEKRYYPLLCLIQVATEHGYYLIDTIVLKKLEELQAFLDMIVDPAILKITHAGENDYKILKEAFNTIPKNTFDTQLAAGFVGYNYPISFQKLVKFELKTKLDKSFSVSDWEARPMSPKQIKYALNDVIYLYPLWEKLSKLLGEKERVSWLDEECKKMEDVSFYYINPLEELLKHNLFMKISKDRQLFLMRLLLWREEEAKNKNCARDMILSGRFIPGIVGNISSDINSLKMDRRTPDWLIPKYGRLLQGFYDKETNPIEEAMLKQLPKMPDENANRDILLDIVRNIIRYKALQHDIAPMLLTSKKDFMQMKNDDSYFPQSLAQGWRKDILGNVMMQWLKKKKPLNIEVKDGSFILSMEN